MGDGNIALWIVGAFVIGGILAAIQQAAVTSPGRDLHAKFVALGNVVGKTRDEIVASVGEPTSISSIPGGVLLQWQATGCHMALKFMGDKCQGYTHQFLSNS
jgi:hypothetical protein